MIERLKKVFKIDFIICNSAGKQTTNFKGSIDKMDPYGYHLKMLS